MLADVPHVEQVPDALPRLGDSREQRLKERHAPPRAAPAALTRRRLSVRHAALPPDVEARHCQHYQVGGTDQDELRGRVSPLALNGVAGQHSEAVPVVCGDAVARVVPTHRAVHTKDVRGSTAPSSPLS